jgi:hypothetical protein
MSRRQTSTGPCRQRSRRRRLRERRPASPGRRRCGTVRRRLLRCLKLLVHRPPGQQTGAGRMNMDTSPSLTSGRLLSCRGRPITPESPDPPRAARGGSRATSPARATPSWRLAATAPTHPLGSSSRGRPKVRANRSGVTPRGGPLRFPSYRSASRRCSSSPRL